MMLFYFVAYPECIIAVIVFLSAFCISPGLEIKKIIIEINFSQ